MKLTKELLEDVMVTALEGGIGYWACLLNDTPEWEEYDEKFPDEPTSVVAAYMLWDGKNISFEHDYDETMDEPAVCSINLKDLERACDQFKRVYHQTVQERIDNSEFDSDDADVIIQFACFGEVIYG